MKLIKIGRSPQSDIVLHSQSASSVHAEIIILDSGELFVIDKNSLNGTFVAGNRIAPNQEVQIKRGDLVAFADEEIVWALVPQAESTKGYKQIVNIGTNYRNDIQLQDAFCSRFHAVVKVSENGKKVIIKDEHSKNGTKINGEKLIAGKEYELKRKDNVVCGETDITEQLKGYFPRSTKWVYPSIAGLIAAAIVCGIIFIPGINMGGGKKINPNEMQPATVYVYTDFHYVITFNDNPIKDYWDGTFELTEKDFEKYKGLSSPCSFSGTAFFIDRNGCLGTNRHIAVPWAAEYMDKNTENAIRNIAVELIQASTGGIEKVPDDNFSTYLRFQNTELGYFIDKSTETVAEMNAALSRLYNSDITISGKADNRYIGYPGRNYTHLSEMERCDLVCESGTDEKDVAILQLNAKKTPNEIKKIFDVNSFIIKDVEPLKDDLYTIGYPGGLEWNLESRSLEPAVNAVKCSKQVNRHYFELQGNTVGGASGSPIFNNKGQLTGVLFGGRSTGATIAACHARWLKELYEQEVATPY